jgi:hypothetical protein
LKISEVCKKKNYETLTLTLKISILQEHGLKELTLVLFESLFFWATHSVLQHFWSDHLLEHSKAMNERQITFK